jgi:hypothetical protein
MGKPKIKISPPKQRIVISKGINSIETNDEINERLKKGM